MVSMLSFLAEQMEDLGIPYEFGEWTDTVSYPYFVGSFSEIESRFEDSYTGGTFTVDGWMRGSKLSLVEAADKIKEKFKDLRAVREGTAFFTAFQNSSFIPTGEEELHRITINIDTKEWKGE